MNENDAKGTVCPLLSARTPGSNAPCVGAQCMLWRWTKVGGLASSKPADTSEGYCGLAGAP